MRKKTFLFIVALLCFMETSLYPAENAMSVTYPVGELGKKWKFPSDHLPVGATIGNIHLASWNILNSQYIFHIMSNEQGLLQSLITTANVPVSRGNPLTVREAMVVEQVLEMIKHPTLPRSLVALQETGSVFFEELKKQLPSRMVCVTAYPGDLAYGDIFIYDTNIFDFVALRSGIYEVRPLNTYMTLTLLEKETNLIYHFTQSHVPGGGIVSSQARKQWVEEILSYHDPDAITVIMGDMNRSPNFLMNDFAEAVANMGFSKQPYANLWIPYPTHVDTHRRASWIDNLFLYNPYEQIDVRISREGKEFFSGLEATMETLNSLRPYPLNVSFEVWCQLKALNVAVLFGAPYSGKTEQIQLAFQDSKVEIFNLKRRFLEDYFRVHNIEDPEERSRIRARYSSEDSFKKLEQEWLLKNNERLFQELEDSTASLVVFDKFDLTTGNILNTDKLATVLLIAKVAKRLYDSGKQTALIIHNSGLQSSPFWKQINEDFSITKSSLIRTKYFSKAEEKYLLGHTLLNRSEKDNFLQWAQGNPTAYLSVMTLLLGGRSPNELTFDHLKADAVNQVKTVWEITTELLGPTVTNILSQLAWNNLELCEIKEFIDPRQLLETGLIGGREGELVMPALVKDAAR